METLWFQFEVVTCPELVISKWTSCIFVHVDGKRHLAARAFHRTDGTKQQHHKLHDVLAWDIDLLGSENGLKDAVTRAFNKAQDTGLITEWSSTPSLDRSLPTQGDAHAQTQLGLMYARGEGVAQNDAEAAKWFRLAAAQGDAQAQYYLGAIYFYGQGVAKDYVEAAKWYRLAAAQGDAHTQTQLGLMYARGQGVAQNDAEAAKWFRLAAAQGHAGAQYNLGAMYQDGKGVAKEYVEAVKWYRLAAAQGATDAQFNLGVAYASGQGVAQDYVRALMWLDLSGASGDVFDLTDPSGDVSEVNARDNEMKVRRDMVAARMTPQQIAESQKMARECERCNFKDCE